MSQTFDNLFEQATDVAPYHYQRRVAENEQLPQLLQVPTGTGTTAAAVVSCLRRFKAVLRDHPDARERWFALRDERLRAAAHEYVAERGIEPTTMPRPRT